MSNPEQSIQDFESRYMGKLRAWGGYVQAADLDALNETLQQLDREARELGAALADASPALRRRWQAALTNVLNLIPSIQQHCETIRDEARKSMGQLDKGQKSLVGYRRAFDSKRVIFDQSG